MELHEIRYSLALAGTLIFTRAAEHCNVTQPALTQAIKSLEDKVGGPLIHRERGNTHLTELGRLMRPYFAEALGRMEEARQRSEGAQARRRPGASAGAALPDRREAERLCGTEFPTSRAAALALRARGAAQAVVTDGAEPATFAAADGVVTANPERIAAPSLTGAGDALVAAHVAAEALGCAPDQAFAEAVAAAERHVTRLAS